MKSRDLVRLFFRTLLIGTLSTFITSFFVKADIYAKYISPFDFIELLGPVVVFLGWGLVFSVVSQMGFFVYLTINQFGLGMFRSLWAPFQVLLIGVALFDLVYFRYRAADGDAPIYMFILVALCIFVYGWIIAGIKAKETNRKAFIPALFFMVVITTIEWVPVLRTEDTDYMWLMIVPLLLCNAYQLLVLHKINEKNGITIKK